MDILSTLDQMVADIILIGLKIKEQVMDGQARQDGLLCVEMAQEEVCRLRRWCKNNLK